MISEQEKVCAEKIAHLEESLKKKKQVPLIISIRCCLKLNAALFLETILNHISVLELRMTKLSAF